MKTPNQPTRAAWRYPQCLVIALLVSSCETSPNELCTHKNGHKWAKWEQVPAPKELSPAWIYSQRTCKHCGKLQGDSTKF